MTLLRWIWAYLFDCVHSRTTWPHRNQFGHAYVCCLDCGREMPYSLEYMQIVGQNRKRNIWGSRSRATASLIITGALLLLTSSHAVAETAQLSADQSHAISSKSRAVSRSTRSGSPASISHFNPSIPA